MSRDGWELEYLENERGLSDGESTESTYEEPISVNGSDSDKTREENESEFEVVVNIGGKVTNISGEEKPPFYEIWNPFDSEAHKLIAIYAAYHGDEEVFESVVRELGNKINKKLDVFDIITNDMILQHLTLAGIKELGEDHRNYCPNIEQEPSVTIREKWSFRVEKAIKNPNYGRGL